MDPDKAWTHGAMWAKSLRLKLSRKNIILEGGELIFPAGEKILERERERERAQTPLYDLRRSVGRNSSSRKRKFIYLMRATRGYRKHGISLRI